MRSGRTGSPTVSKNMFVFNSMVLIFSVNPIGLRGVALIGWALVAASGPCVGGCGWGCGFVLWVKDIEFETVFVVWASACSVMYLRYRRLQ